MANVDMALTPITVNSVARSFIGCAGRTVESASAADAPQIATEPPVNKPNTFLKPPRRASIRPTRMVVRTAPTTKMTGIQPSAAIWP